MTRLKYIIRLFGLILLSTVLSISIRNIGVEKENIILVFLVGVILVTSITNGYIYGAVASVMSIFIINYLFTNPVHTFWIDNPNDIVLLFFFFTASLITSSLTSRFQKQLNIAKKNEHTARVLCEITKSFLNTTGKKEIIMQGISYIFNHTSYRSSVVLLEGNESYTNIEENKKQSTFKLEITGAKEKFGELLVYYDEKKLTLENELLIKMVVAQIGISLDREFIYNERENIRIAMEGEQLKSNLLRAISHDLRSPLTGIVGASGVILENIDKLDYDSIKKLVRDINEESLWLNTLVENILNMTRIGEGKLVIEKQDEVVDDIINEALRHTSNLINDRNIEVSLPKEVVYLPMDGKLIVQVLINLLDNAIKHTNDKCNIYLNVYTKDKDVIFEVADDGEGIDEKIKNKMFESFVTSSGKVVDSKRGMGLGLAICKAIVEAHGGVITAKNIKGGGALFRFTLPLREE